MDSFAPSPLRRQPYSPTKTSRMMPLRAQNGSAPASPGTPLTFDSLADVLLRTFDVTPFVWKKTIDWASQILLFYQVDARGVVPKISKCVRVHCEGFLSANPMSGHRLVPSIFMGDKPVSSSYMKAIIGRDHILSVSDLMKLLEILAAARERGGSLETGENGTEEPPYNSLPLSEALEEDATDVEEFPIVYASDAEEGAFQVDGQHAAEADCGDLDPTDEELELEPVPAPRKTSKRKRTFRSTRLPAASHQRATDAANVPSTSATPQPRRADKNAVKTEEGDQSAQSGQSTRDYGPTRLPFMLEHFYRDLVTIPKTAERRKKRSAICRTCHITICDVEKNTSSFIRHAKIHKAVYAKYLDEHPARHFLVSPQLGHSVDAPGSHKFRKNCR